MKLSINRHLLQTLIERISGALDRSPEPPNAPGKFITLEADDNALSAFVLRPEISVIGCIEKDKLGEKAGLMSIETPGACRVDGDMLSKAISGCAIEGNLIMEFKKNENQCDENSGPGTLLITFDPNGSDSEFFGLQCSSPFKKDGLKSPSPNTLVIEGSNLYARTKEVGVAAGKMSMAEEFANVLIRNSGLDAEMVTTNGIQIAVAKFKAQSSSSDVECSVPYDLFAMAMKMCSEDQEIQIQGSGGKMSLNQMMSFASGVIGEIKVFISSATVDFPSVEKKLSRTDFRFTCKARKTDFDVCCKKLEVVSMLRSSVTFDPDEKQITFTKKEERGFSKTVLPLVEAEGKRLDTEFSSTRFKECVKFCSGNDLVEIKFSGRSSVALIMPHPGLFLYFSPYGSGE